MNSPQRRIVFCKALLLTKEEYGFSREVVLGVVRENHPVIRSGCHPSFVRRGAFRSHVFFALPLIRIFHPFCFPFFLPDPSAADADEIIVGELALVPFFRWLPFISFFASCRFE